MKTILVTAVLLFAAASGMAQEETPTTSTAPPDFSKDTLVRMFAETTIEAPRERVDFGFGYVDFRALGMRWRVGYLPFLAPMQGSQSWRVDHRWPDPFILTGTSIATTPRTFARTREVNSELRRLERRLKKDAQVTVKPE